MSNEAQTIADLAVKAAGAHIVSDELDGRRWLVVPAGFTSEEVTDPHGLVITNPGRIKQLVTVQTVDSLVDYVNRFKGENTLLFADLDRNSIVALIDYHGPADAAHVDHKAVLTLPFSFEWQTWKALDGKYQDQLAFARFLEENAAEVEAPSGAELLEVCRDLQAVRRVNFTKAVRTSSDNENFEWTDETNATSKRGSVEVPSKFLLRLPVYFGDPSLNLGAFLRWRLNDNSLELGFALHRAEHVRQARFKEIVSEIADRTGRSAVFGKASA